MKTHVIVLGTALFAAAPLAAQTNSVTTDPVGVMRYVFNTNSDTSVALPMPRAEEFAGAIGAVGSNWVTAFATSNAPINWVNNDWTYGVGTNANNTYYTLFTSGNLEGLWFKITANNSNTLFVDTSRLANTGFADLPAAGAVTNDTFKVVPFWTLNTVFPDGQGFTPSPNPFSPSASVIFPDLVRTGFNIPPSSSYFYYDGSIGGDAAWYKAGDIDAGTFNNLPINPDNYVIVRNLGSTKTNFVAGSVSMNDHAGVLSRKGSGLKQDNYVALSFPVDTSLIDSDLHNSPGFTQSPNPFSPEDILIVLSEGAGINKPPIGSFFYYDGSIGGDPAWYKNGDLDAGPQDSSIVFKAGSGYIIRKGTGSVESALWTATPNYSP